MPNSDFGGAHIIETWAFWTQPSVPGDSRYTNFGTAPDASFWTGLGNDNLIQAGADSIATATPQYRFWTEDYPQGTVWEGPTLRPGDAVYVDIYYNDDSTATYALENLTTNQYDIVTHPTPYVAWRAADFINERLGPYLPKFGSPYFNQCGAQAVSPNLYLQSSNSDAYTMTTNGTSTGTIQSQPSSVYNSNDAFDVWWKHS